MLAEGGGGGGERERAERLARLFQEFQDSLDQGRDLSAELLARARELAPDLEAKIRLELELRTLARDLGVSERAPGAPQTLGRFQILGLLGQGGISRVFLAFDPKLGRKIALKVLDRDAMLDKDQRAWILNEARSLACLDHPHVVKVFEIGETDTHAFVAMEHLSGPSLEEVVRALRAGAPRASADPEPSSEAARALAARLTPYSARLELLAELAEALAYCHDHGILHRDVKPKNVLFDEHGAPRLIDFGLAHVEGADEDSRLGLTQTLVGTAAYIAPEQVASDQTGADPRSDQFAFATLAYECVALVNPFAARSRRATLAAVESADPPPLRRAAPAAPPALATVLAHAHAREPDARYPGMAALAADLRAVLAHRPISVANPSLVALVRLWTRRHRRAVVAVGATLASVLALVAGGWLLGARAEREEILGALRAIRPEEFVGPDPFDASYDALLELRQRARSFDAGELRATLLGSAWPAAEERLHTWARELGRNYAAESQASAEAGSPLQEILYQRLFAKEEVLCPECDENLEYRRRGTVELPFEEIGTREHSLEIVVARMVEPDFYSVLLETKPTRYPVPGIYRLQVWERGAKALAFEAVYPIFPGWRVGTSVALRTPREEFWSASKLVASGIWPLNDPEKGLCVPAFRLLPRLVSVGEYEAFLAETGSPWRLGGPRSAEEPACPALAGAHDFARWAGGRLPFSQELLLARERKLVTLVPGPVASAEYLLDASPNAGQSLYFSYRPTFEIQALKLVVDETRDILDSEKDVLSQTYVGFRLVFSADSPEAYRSCAAEPVAALPPGADR